MKVGVSHSVILSVVFSILCYVILSLSFTDSAIAITAALSLLLGGSVIPFIASFAFNRSKSESNVDASGELTTLYVGNLPYRANEQVVKAFFTDHVAVQSVRLMKDRKTGKRKGYGFLEVITSDVDGLIGTLNDIEFQERNLKVRLAKDKTE